MSEYSIWKGFLLDASPAIDAVALPSATGAMGKRLAVTDMLI
jgi:hypothetical protein